MFRKPNGMISKRPAAIRSKKKAGNKIPACSLTKITGGRNQEKGPGKRRMTVRRRILWRGKMDPDDLMR